LTAHHSFVLAVAAGQGPTVLQAVDALGLVPALDPPNLTWNGTPVALLILKQSDVTLPWSSASPGGLWDVYLLISVLPASQGRAAQRKLRRASLTQPTYIRGPWSVQQVIEDYPSQAASLFPGGFIGHCIEGDDLETNAQTDYRPTDQDALDDIDSGG